MKTTNIFKSVIVLFFIGLCVSSCVQDDEFDIPEIYFEEPNINVNTSIQAVIAMYGGFEPVLIGDGNSTPLYFEAYVVSSDESGNFYKQLIVQDKAENPIAGISIATEATNMYTFFEPGRKIYVRVDGLYSGLYATLPTLGVLQGSEVGRMSVEEFNARVFRSTLSQELVPVLKTFGSLTNNDLNTLVKFETVQVSDQDLGQTYANPNNTYSVNRNFINCEYTESMIVRNSGFADFKNEIMPTGSGTLTAIHSTFNNTYQLLIRDTNDVDFDQERCVYTGGYPQGSMLYEDFEEIVNTGPGELIDLPGWTNENISGGNRKYEAREFSNNKYAHISAFSSGETAVEAWLVTPQVSLEKTVTPKLTFLTKDGFNNGEGLKVYLSTNFTGDPATATWEELSATIATGTTSGYAENFTPSGEIDLSIYNGQSINIGFEYVGGDGGISTTYQIDEISILDE